MSADHIRETAAAKIVAESRDSPHSQLSIHTDPLARWSHSSALPPGHILRRCTAQTSSEDSMHSSAGYIAAPALVVPAMRSRRGCTGTAAGPGMLADGAMPDMHHVMPDHRRHTGPGTAAADSRFGLPVAARAGCSDRSMSVGASVGVAEVAVGRSGPGCSCTTWQQLCARRSTSVDSLSLHAQLYLCRLCRKRCCADLTCRLRGGCPQCPHSLPSHSFCCIQTSSWPVFCVYSPLLLHLFFKPRSRSGTLRTQPFWDRVAFATSQALGFQWVGAAWRHVMRVCRFQRSATPVRCQGRESGQTTRRIHVQRREVSPVEASRADLLLLLHIPGPLLG